MFCPNCGKQLPDDARFCGGCGNQMEAPRKEPDVKVYYPGPEHRVPKAASSSIRLDELKNRNLFFFGSLVTLFVAMLFLFGKQIRAKVSLWGFTEIETFSMFMDHNFWKVLFILLYLGAIAVALLPLIIGGKWKLWNQIPAAGVSGLGVLWLLIVLIAAKVELSNQGFGSGMAKIGFSFGGVVFLLLNFGTVALSVLSFLKDMKDGMKFF